MKLAAPVRVIGGLIAVVVLIACGGGRADISETAAAELQERVAEIRMLAEERDAAAVIDKVDELRSLVEQLLADGEISDDAAESILQSASAVAENVATITTTTTTVLRDDDDDDGDDDDDDDDGDDGDGDDDDKGKDGDGRNGGKSKGRGNNS